MDNFDILKKKILYRSNHRGSKELDVLLSNFVKKYIDSFDEVELKELDSLLNIDDEILYKWYFNLDTKTLVTKNKVTKKLKEFKLWYYGGKGGIRTHE